MKFLFSILRNVFKFSPNDYATKCNMGSRSILGYQYGLIRAGLIYKLVGHSYLLSDKTVIPIDSYGRKNKYLDSEYDVLYVSNHKIILNIIKEMKCLNL
jgi:hypothetical protein